MGCEGTKTVHSWHQDGDKPCPGCEDCAPLPTVAEMSGSCPDIERWPHDELARLRAALAAAERERDEHAAIRRDLEAARDDWCADCKSVDFANEDAARAYKEWDEAVKRAEAAERERDEARGERDAALSEAARLRKEMTAARSVLYTCVSEIDFGHGSKGAIFDACSAVDRVAEELNRAIFYPSEPPPECDAAPDSPAAPFAPSSEYRRGYERAIEDATCIVEDAACANEDGDGPCEGAAPLVAAIRSLLPAPEREWTEDEVERIACVMAEVRNGEPCWDVLIEVQRDRWRVMARAVLAAIGRGGE